jgi:hypothetical protein
MLWISSREGVIDTECLLPVQASAVLNVAGRMPRLADGTELIGEYQGSGFQEQKLSFAGLMARLSSCLPCGICWPPTSTASAISSR